MTEFEPIIGFGGVIEINRNGEIRSLARNGTPEKILKSSIGTNGYSRVSFRVFGKQYTKNIHRLLAESFIPNPENHPCVNHKDGDKQNNKLGNLEWCTYSRNIQHAYDTGITKPYKGAKGTNLTDSMVLEIIDLKKSGNTLDSISRMFNVSAACVSDIAQGRTWSHVTGIKFNSNSSKGKNPATGEKGIVQSHNGKFDVFVFLNGKNIYLIRIPDFSIAKEAKIMADKLINEGREIKQVVEVLRSIFNS